ncbi:MAG: hypothetical protein KBB83_05465 [Alphaproteobacteria bacterium]|nr:hypothetical protein [Alphaproteobacteria bacterium]
MSKFFTAVLFFIFTLSVGQEALASDASRIKWPGDLAKSYAQEKLPMIDKAQPIAKESVIDKKIEKERQALQVSFLILCARNFSRESSWYLMDKKVLNKILRLSHNSDFILPDNDMPYEHRFEFLDKCLELSRLMPFKRLVNLYFDFYRNEEDYMKVVAVENEIISHSGYNLETIECINQDADIHISFLETIAQKCKNLKSLKLADGVSQSVDPKDDRIEKSLLGIFQNNPQLTTFVFETAGLLNVLKSNAYLRRALMTRIKTLAIRLDLEVSALMIEAAGGESCLESLDLLLGDVNLDGFTPFFKVCGHLKSIKTEGTLSLDFCTGLASSCPELSKIDFSDTCYPQEHGDFGNVLIRCIANNFKNLKALYLPDAFTEDITDASIQVLINHCKRIEVLSIPHSGISEAGESALRKECRKLWICDIR